jgi:hypothetical protein
MQSANTNRIQNTASNKSQTGRIDIGNLYEYIRLRYDIQMPRASGCWRLAARNLKRHTPLIGKKEIPKNQRVDGKTNHRRNFKMGFKGKKIHFPGIDTAIGTCIYNGLHGAEFFYRSEYSLSWSRKHLPYWKRKIHCRVQRSPQEKQDESNPDYLRLILISYSHVCLYIKSGRFNWGFPTKSLRFLSLSQVTS